MSKPLPILPHMPWNIKRDIVEAVDYKTRISLRRCSSEFKALVDDAKHVELVIRCWYYDTVDVIVIFSENCYKIFEFLLLKNRNYIELAVERVRNILKSSKFRLQTLEIQFQKSYRYERLVIETQRRLLDGLTPVLRSRKLIVEKLVMNTDGNHEYILLFLSFIQPRTLKHICLGASVMLPLNLTEIAETEQWKEAERLSLERFDHTLPLEKMYHFISVETHRYKISEEELDYIVDTFFEDNGWETRTYYIKHHVFYSLKRYFSKFEAVDNSRHSQARHLIEAQFKVRRGDRECRIIVYKARREYIGFREITFFNPSKRLDLSRTFE